MRLVFFGSSEFAIPTLKALKEHFLLVVSQPDRPSGRGGSLLPTPVKKAALELGLPVETPEKCRDEEFIARIRSLNPDALLVVAYGQIMPVKLLESAKRGGINIHASLLPKYRGAAPIAWAILNGETETGITIMQMDAGMDTGDIIAQEKTEIFPDETAGELAKRLSELGAKMALEWMPRIVSGDYPRTPQDEGKASLAPKLTSKDGELHFEMDAEDAYRRFRAVTPNPGAYLETRFGRMKILEAKRSELRAEKAGIVLAIEGESVVVSFLSNSLRLQRVQIAGRKPMTGKDFVNGYRLRIGDFISK
ncbi:MAG TPA: methionyl-tRNA formyltransferase [Fimbriimonadales bacterium]|nr:methionyl-tRNA formyltransferase [Fimbriimonadales bacterium]